MITAAALGALRATASGALAGDTNCAIPMTHTRIEGNVVVPDGKTRELTGLKVTGNVTVGHDATLDAEQSTIAGNVQADHCRSVFVGQGAVVGGNFQIAHCTADSGYVDGPVFIGGDFQCHDNTAACFAEEGIVGGNVQVDNNVSASQHPSQIGPNSIAKNLQCQGNSPPPIGKGNKVAGNKEGQCAGF
jgi:hypothetical protein